MKPHPHLSPVAAVCIVAVAMSGVCHAQSSVDLPPGVKAVWDLSKAYRETTPTRERVCINGLWRWQPARGDTSIVPTGNWGYFKVPGPWPGLEDWLQKDCQTVHAHPSWKDDNLAEVTSAWYQREITIPATWAGRRITVHAEYLNSFAAVHVDGKPVGEMRFPAGEVDLTSACRTGGKHVLSLLVVAMPLKGVMMSYNDTSLAREVRGSVERRGLCGDVYLLGEPMGALLTDVKVDTSVRNGEITFETGVQGLSPDARYSLRARITDKGRRVVEFASKGFTTTDTRDGRIAFAEKWKPDKLWDTHTPRNQYDLTLSLLDPAGKVLDTATPVRFGFREFTINGRDFYLNGTRIFLSVVPLDNACIGPGVATYETARESLLRLRSFGVNFVYTHNYGCEPGTHVSFAEVLRAADDVGVLVALSQPHFGQYDWQAPDADQNNGYARHAEFYARVAQNHPSVVAYSMSHNATGYVEDMNPDMMDGVQDPRPDWARNSIKPALRAEAIVKRFDPVRIVYHHSSGNLGSMHTNNFYPNFVPIQEMDDWFEHWSTKGVKPEFLCEFAAPCTWDFSMYRGWYRGGRTFGSAVVPWELCFAEWNSQFFGDRAFQITEVEKESLRWEAAKFRSGEGWHRWDYPHQIGTTDYTEQYPVLARYIASNWRAFRTWGVSAINPWEHHCFWKLREGVDRSRKELKVDWDNLQRPGFSPDYIGNQYERMDLAFQQSDWIPTPAAEALLRNNMPLLAYIGGKSTAFTSKDHNFTPGETVEKQLIVINNSRGTVTCDCKWSLGVPNAINGSRKVTVATGEQERIPLRFELPPALAPGKYDLTASVKFSSGETQEDSFAVNVLPPPDKSQIANPKSQIRLALFDPRGESGKLLSEMGLRCESVEANADLSAYQVVVIGKGALMVDGPAPDLSRVRDGLRVIVFEQTSEALEKRLGFRVTEYGLRQVFKRVPDHPLLAGLGTENLCDWRGEATILPPRLKYEMSPRYQYTTPTVKWCDLDVPRIWRCGCRGNVASVLIEKPARGDFLPIIDGGYSLQYSPLMEYREGRGIILFCQMDVTGRTEADPAATRLVRNMLSYLSDPTDRSDRSIWQPSPRRKPLYVGDPVGQRHLEAAGVVPASYARGKLSADQVLVVGAGGDEKLSGNAAEVADFLKSGGNLLALGLDEREANAFLPFKVGMKKGEHIASFFEPPGVSSLMTGVGPADVHNRAPRELPLVSAGAAVIGDGVLAKGQDANVVFFQLPPYTVTSAGGAVPSFVIDTEDAFDGKQSALVTMGTATEAGGQFGQGVKVTPQVGKSYTFAVFVKGVGGPIAVHLEVERAGRPWDRAVKGGKVVVPENQWTDVHITCKCDKPFAEGWQAYIGCGQEGGRFRADLFRLYKGEYVPWKAAGGAGEDPGQPRNLITNPGFEEGEKPWWFMYGEQYNLRRTYRRASFTLTRLLANMGVSGSTPLLSRFKSPVLPTKPEKRWLDGLYLDQPEEWDDPYRFFCW